MVTVFIDHQPPGCVVANRRLVRNIYTDTAPAEVQLPSYAVAIICTSDGNTDPAVIAIGSFRRSARVTTFARRYEVSAISAMETPVSLNRIYQELPPQSKHYFSPALTEKWVLAEATSDNFISVLSQAADDAAEMIERASGFPRGLSQLTPARSALLAEEKDAFGLIADLTGLGRHVGGIGRRMMVPPGPINPSQTYMDTLRLSYNDEEALVDFDMSHFDGVLGERARRNARGMVIRHPAGTITVLNTSNRDLEHTEGCDLIYYSAARNCGILVQYKRMKREGDGWVYRGDIQLAKELHRMRSTNTDALPYGVAEYRLNNEAHYLKIVRPTDYDGQSAELMKGLYLPLTLVGLMERSPEDSTKAGSLRITWDDERWPTQRHLNNTAFTQLFRDGWIGSCGSTSGAIRSWIEPLFDADELITIAVSEPPGTSDWPSA